MAFADFSVTRRPNVHYENYIAQNEFAEATTPRHCIRYVSCFCMTARVY